MRQIVRLELGRREVSATEERSTSPRAAIDVRCGVPRSPTDTQGRVPSTRDSGWESITSAETRRALKLDFGATQPTPRSGGMLAEYPIVEPGDA